MNIVSKARLIAKTAHAAIEQKRKYTGHDYIVHPAEVVSILRKAGVTDKVALAAAWLHDTVEDTGITLNYIRVNVDQGVANVVEMVTDISKPEDGNRKIRKLLDREHYLTADYRGKSVKLADCLSNGKDIEKNDRDFSRVYFKEIKLLLPYLRGGCSELFYMVESMIKEYEIREENERLQAALKEK